MDEWRFLSCLQQASIDFGRGGSVYKNVYWIQRLYVHIFCVLMTWPFIYILKTQSSENRITSVQLSRSPEKKQRLFPQFLINSPASDSFILILILTNVLIPQPFYTSYYQFISLVSSLGDLPDVEIFDLYTALHFILSQLARI